MQCKVQRNMATSIEYVEFVCEQILDNEDGDLSNEVVALLKKVTPLPKPKKKKTDIKKQ